jgi:hypothetical protein
MPKTAPTLKFAVDKDSALDLMFVFATILMLDLNVSTLSALERTLQMLIDAQLMEIVFYLIFVRVIEATLV